MLGANMVKMLEYGWKSVVRGDVCYIIDFVGTTILSTEYNPGWQNTITTGDLYAKPSFPGELYFGETRDINNIATSCLVCYEGIR